MRMSRKTTADSSSLQVELETQLNTLKATQQMEHLRATDLARKTVDAEAFVKQV